MGKSLSRVARKNNKFITREDDRKLKEQQQFQSLINEDAQKEKPKVKWRPHSEIDVD